MFEQTRTLGLGKLREVDVHRNVPVGVVGVVSEQNELAARIRRHSRDPAHAHLVVVFKLVDVPADTLVETVHDVVRRLLVVGHDEHRTAVTELPEVRVLADLLPSETAVARQESVRVAVLGEILADIADGHHKTNDGRAAVGGADVVALGEAMQLEGAFLGA